MNAQLSIPAFAADRCEFQTRLDAVRRAKSRKIQNDPRLLALAVMDAIYDDAELWGEAFLLAAAYAALNGNPALQMMLTAAANEAALECDL